MEKTKIIHLLHSVGGVDISLRLILNNINCEIFENIVIHGHSDTASAFYDNKNNKIKAYKIPIFREISIFNDLIAIYKAYRIIRKERPNIIHVHSAKGGIIGRFIGKFIKIKILFTPQAFSYLSESKGIKRTLFLSIEKFFANSNTILLASSNSEKQRALNEVRYKKDKIMVFENCINPITIIEPLSIPKTWPDNYICTVGRPSFQKNIDSMIDVIFEIKKQRPIHLLLVGVGYYAPELENVVNKIKKLHLEYDITLLNWTNREDVLHIISNSQLYISTSRYEGLPYSIIESLALGKPCVVSDCDGNRDLIVDEYNGFVIKNNNTTLFKDKIVDLLTNNSLHRTFSEKALQLYKDKYNIENNIKQLEEIYLQHSI